MIIFSIFSFAPFLRYIIFKSSYYLDIHFCYYLSAATPIFYTASLFNSWITKVSLNKYDFNISCYITFRQPSSPQLFLLLLQVSPYLTVFLFFFHKTDKSFNDFFFVLAEPTRNLWSRSLKLRSSRTFNTFMTLTSYTDSF